MVNLLLRLLALLHGMLSQMILRGVDGRIVEVRIRALIDQVVGLERILLWLSEGVHAGS